MVRTSIKVLERRIDELRAAVRRAAMAGDPDQARTLRADLRRAELAWEEALADIESQTPPRTPAPPTNPQPSGTTLLPLREQVHHALTLLTVPAAPRLIVAVHEAFFSGELVAARLTSLRRDEERSFHTASHSRPYYLCPALAYDLFSPARGLLTVSTWSLADRIVGPLSPRVHFLTAAINVAEHVERLTDPGPAASRLLWRFAANIPGAAEGPGGLARAAREELTIHASPDLELRESSAERAAAQLTESDQLFGTKFRVVEGSGTES
jgi:hypothetical protein